MPDSQPDNSYWQLIDPIWRSVSIYDGAEVFLHQFEQLRPEVGHLFAAQWCVSEVCNGGLHQFFANSTGVLAPESLEGFRAIGLKKLAAILAEAMQFFGPRYPRDREERSRLLPRADGRKRREWDPFFRLDKRFFKWLDADRDGWKHAANAYAARVSI